MMRPCAADCSPSSWVRVPALAFPEPSWWWLAWVALVPWLWLLRRADDARDAAWLGWCGGLGFMLATHWWLLPNLLIFLPVVCAVMALLWVPFGLAAYAFLGPGPTAQLHLAAAVVVVPSTWLLVEVVRSVDRLGGPWGLLGASQWNSPTLPVASIGGVWLLSWLVVACNVLVAALPARRAGAGLLVGFAVVLVAQAVAPQPSASRSVSVGVVQPGVLDDAAARFDRGEQLTRTLVGQSLALVVWGESSVGFDLASRPDLLARLSALSAEVGAPILVNVDARSSAEAGITKASVLISSEGEVARYDKSRLVPFGEYVPFRPIFGWASSFLEAADEDRVRGDAELVVMPVGDFGVGPLVCFESAFPDMTRALAEAGADLIVIQAATSTFQDSWAPEQHASLAAVRATESGRPVVHSTLTGVTTAFDAGGGQVGQVLSTSDVGATVYRIPLVSGETWFVRAGSRGAALVGLLLAAASLAVVISRGVSARRRLVSHS